MIILTKNNEKGLILVITFVVMVTLTVITGVFLFLVSTRLKSAGYNLADSRAFWLAEAGIQKAIYELKNDSDFRDDPKNIQENFGDGSYSVSVSKSGTIYTLTSTGIVGEMKRKLSQGIKIVVEEVDEDKGKDKGKGKVSQQVTITPQKDWQEIVPAT